MKKGDLLFVYGTLRPGESNGLDRSFEATHVCQDRINGEMFHLGGYPGVTSVSMTSVEFDPSVESVVGDIFRLKNDRIVTGLDMYEGYPNLYNRVEVMTESGKKVWVYTYNHNVDNRHKVEGGDWKRRIAVRAYQV